MTIIAGCCIGNALGEIIKSNYNENRAILFLSLSIITLPLAMLLLFGGLMPGFDVLFFKIWFSK
jgi:hypothetical protein